MRFFDHDHLAATRLFVLSLVIFATHQDRIIVIIIFWLSSVQRLFNNILPHQTEAHLYLFWWFRSFVFFTSDSILTRLAQNIFTFKLCSRLLMQTPRFFIDRVCDGSTYTQTSQKTSLQKTLSMIIDCILLLHHLVYHFSCFRALLLMICSDFLKLDVWIAYMADGVAFSIVVFKTFLIKNESKIMCWLSALTASADNCFKTLRVWLSSWMTRYLH